MSNVIGAISSPREIVHVYEQIHAQKKNSLTSQDSCNHVDKNIHVVHRIHVDKNIHMVELNMLMRTRQSRDKTITLPSGG